MRPAKLFTVEAANGLLPRLGYLVERLQDGARRLHAELRDLAHTEGIDPDALSTPELLRRRPGARRLVEELDAIVHEIEEEGAELKDIQLGLVDFPAERDGQAILLCWQLGEPEVAFWHGPTDGFAGRRPLPHGARLPPLQ
ncbi:MAG TPA: DUF2203 domain-containing protein [Candidatus Binatia bacterium]|nr:DUF2203 domain-containing protein [Candidatus Binatia bacterium]